jgi:hypothetical protein
VDKVDYELAIKKKRAEQNAWSVAYENRLLVILSETIVLGDFFALIEDFDLDGGPLTDNKEAAGEFTSNFIDALDNGFFDDLFDDWYNKRINIEICLLTISYINTNIFYDLYRISPLGHEQDVIVSELLCFRINRYLDKWR